MMNPDKFLTDLAALTGCFRVDVMCWPDLGDEAFAVVLWASNGPKSGTGPTVEAAMQEARAKLAEHYA